MEALRNWIMALAATGLICGAAKALSPEGAVKKTVSVICGFAMMAALLSIAGDVEALGLSRYAAKYSMEAEKSAGDALEAARAQTRAIIEARCEAYILDKGRLIGLGPGDVEVTARWSEEGFWYPERAELHIKEDPDLSRVMEAELGILRENQIWSTDDEG